MSFQDLTRARYSCRSYEQRPVEPAKLEAIVEAGRIAPSAHNNHPTRLIVCDTPEALERAARERRVDLVLGSAGLVVRLADAGAKPIVTTLGHGAINANQNEGSAFLVRIPVALFMASLPNTSLTLVGLSTPITTVYGILFFLVCFAWMKRKRRL